MIDKMDAMKANLTLRYDGGTVADGSLDVYELGASLMAFRNFLAFATDNSIGKNTMKSARVEGLRAGSFNIDIVVSMGGILSTVFSGPASVKDLWDVISGSFDLIKHLRGEPPLAVETVKGGVINVTNHLNVTGSFNNSTVYLVSNDDAGKAMQEFVGSPLFKTAEVVEIIADDRVIASATRADAPYFKPINMAKSINSYEAVMALEIESLAFKKGNKWRFNAGDNSFFATVEDVVFLKNVDSGRELFGKGDLIRARVVVSQLKSSSGLKSEYTVIEVLEHTRPPIQTVLE